MRSAARSAFVKGPASWTPSSGSTFHSSNSVSTACLPISRICRKRCGNWMLSLPSFPSRASLSADQPSGVIPERWRSPRLAVAHVLRLGAGLAEELVVAVTLGKHLEAFPVEVLPVADDLVAGLWVEERLVEFPRFGGHVFV